MFLVWYWAQVDACITHYCQDGEPDGYVWLTLRLWNNTTISCVIQGGPREIVQNKKMINRTYAQL